MVLNEDTGAAISLEEGQAFAKSFREKYPDEIKSLFAGSKIIRSILAQDDCVGIRIYNGYNDKEQRFNSVLVGVDSKGEDIRDIVADDMLPCPSYCPKKDLLVVK